MALPPVIKIFIPLSRVIIPRVARIGETRIPAISIPLHRPMIIAAPPPASSVASAVAAPGG